MAIKSLRPRHTRSQNAGSRRPAFTGSSFFIYCLMKMKTSALFFLQKSKNVPLRLVNLNLVNNKWRLRRRLFFWWLDFDALFSKLAGKVEMSHPMNVFFFFFYLLKLSFAFVLFLWTELLWRRRRRFKSFHHFVAHRWHFSFFSGGFLGWRQSCYRRGGFLTGFFFIHSSKIK